MVDIQSATAEIRRGKKERRKKPQGKNIMSASAMQGGHNNADVVLSWGVLSGAYSESLCEQRMVQL